jgi:hypothetical protein
MASLNRVFLIGIVASPPADDGDTSEFRPRGPPGAVGRTWLERVRVNAAERLAETETPARANGREVTAGDVRRATGRSERQARRLLAAVVGGDRGVRPRVVHEKRP